MSVRVKICGITRPEDARHAASCGASAIGLVFWPGSPRCVTVQRAREVTTAVAGSGITCVGVFVDQPHEFVRAAIGGAGLQAIQLHGHEAVAEYRFGVPILKAFGVGAAWHVGMLSDLPDDVMPLLDATNDGRSGGMGAAIDWTLAAAATSVRPIVLAGGLTPENVGRAIAMVAPFAVDTSSGVETSPGVKDRARVRAFVAAVEKGSGAVPRRFFA